MKPDLEKWNVVINGAWNVAIFSPPWVGRRFKDLFGAQQIQVEVFMDPGGTQVRYSHDDLVLLPRANHLVIAFRNFKDGTSHSVERMAVSLVQELPHTPVTGFGINFGFVDETPSQALLDLFNLSDAGCLTGYEIESTALVRSIRVKDAVLNLTFDLEHKSKTLRVDLNFHHDIADGHHLATLLEGRVSWCKNFADEFLSKAYGLVVEE